MSKRKQTLLSWSGLGREPFTFRAGRVEPGAHLNLLRDSEYAGTFDRHVLLCVPETLRDGEELVKELSQLPKPVNTNIKVLHLADPTDHRELAYALSHFLEDEDDSERVLDDDLFVLLNTGTPQMQTVWILLRMMGLLDFKILQTTPPHLARRSGVPDVREMELKPDALNVMYREVQERQSAR